METPSSKAESHLEHIGAYCLPEAQSELGIDPLHGPFRVVYFISVIGYSPYRPFSPPTEGTSMSSAESEDANQTVLSWLRSGTDPSVVERKLRRMQCWRWGAIAVDDESLVAELQSRYELGDSETDFGWEAIPGGVVITCRILPRMWGGLAHP
jgi:hypothetical protein